MPEQRQGSPPSEARSLLCRTWSRSRQRQSLQAISNLFHSRTCAIVIQFGARRTACTNCAYGFISHFDHDATAEEHDVR